MNTWCSVDDAYEHAAPTTVHDLAFIQAHELYHPQQQGLQQMTPMNQFTDLRNTTVFVGGLSSYVKGTERSSLQRLSEGIHLTNRGR